MNGLNLANPKMMDVAVPANLRVGRGQADDAHPECAMTAQEIMHHERPDDILVDLREDGGARTGRARSRNAIHAPYGQLAGMIGPGGALRARRPRAPGSGSSTIAPSASARRWRWMPRAESGLGNVCHMIGGIAAWPPRPAAVSKSVDPTRGPAGRLLRTSLRVSVPPRQGRARA